MRVDLAYGESGLAVELPDAGTVVTPRRLQAVADERLAVLDALRRPLAGPPLRDRVAKGRRVAISMCDGTRPQPRPVVLAALL